MESLRRLASELEVPERTLRRAAAEGLIHGERISPRRFRTTLREETYLSAQWPMLSQLRASLRTEPNVRLAVLFGSLALSAGRSDSDIDLLVVLDDESIERLLDLAERQSRRMSRDVQPVRLLDAERSPALMADVLRHGRVLIDRDDRWAALTRGKAKWLRRAQAQEEVPLAVLDEPVSHTRIAR